MIRKALGTLIRRTAVTATTKRTIGRFAVRMSTMIGPAKSASRIVAIGPRMKIRRASGRTTLPRVVRLPQDRLSAVTCPRPRANGLAELGLGPRRASVGSTLTVPSLLVDPTHDGIERGHHRHRVGD